MRFTKMQGAGNDYIYVDCFRQPMPHDPHQPTALIIINLTHPQAICRQPSLPESRPPGRQGKCDLLWH